MMKRTKVAVIGLAIVFVAVSGAYAQGQEKPRQGGQEKKDAIYQELGVTPEQEKKLEDNRIAQHQEGLNLREAMRVNHEKLRVKLNDPAVTRAAIEPLVKEMKSLQMKVIDHSMNGIFTVKSILTPEQFVKFNEIMEKRQKDKKGRSEGGQGKPKGPPPAKE
jgi:Spy/CpxP family protein refolding chaperone